MLVAVRASSTCGVTSLFTSGVPSCRGTRRRPGVASDCSGGPLAIRPAEVKNVHGVAHAQHDRHVVVDEHDTTPVAGSPASAAPSSSTRPRRGRPPARPRAPTTSSPSQSPTRWRSPLDSSVGRRYACSPGPSSESSSSARSRRRRGGTEQIAERPIRRTSSPRRSGYRARSGRRRARRLERAGHVRLASWAPTRRLRDSLKVHRPRGEAVNPLAVSMNIIFPAPFVR